MSPTAADRGWGSPGAPGSPAAAQYRKQHIVTIDVGGVRLQVRREVAPLFAGFIMQIVQGGYDLSELADDWGYASRYVRGYEAQKILSNHAWGLAVDLNATTNPMTSDGKVHTDMPDWVVDAANRWSLAWGGDYKSRRKDPMHFEFTGTPADAANLIMSMHPATHSEDSLLMAIAKDDNDARHAWVREQCLTFWGQEPSVADHDFLAHEVELKGVDNVLAQIADHSYAKAFRAKRGW